MAPSDDGNRTRLPAIEITGRQLREVTDAALEALIQANTPPRLFRRGGILFRLQLDEGENQIRLVPLVGKVMRHHLARVANWFQEGEPTAPPVSVIGDLEALPNYLDVPPLDAVVTCLVVTPSGDWLAQPGYHPSGLWYQPDPDLVVQPPPAVPTGRAVCQARDWINDNLLVDFPFVAACDRAVAWACLLLPFVRPPTRRPTNGNATAAGRQHGHGRRAWGSPCAV